jgi:hypothetical protein
VQRGAHDHHSLISLPNASRRETEDCQLRVTNLYIFLKMPAAKTTALLNDFLQAEPGAAHSPASSTTLS